MAAAAARSFYLITGPSPAVFSRSNNPQATPGRRTGSTNSSNTTADTPLLLLGRRHCLTALTLLLPVANGLPSQAAILEADDDEELLERVKKDRKKRLQRQEVISSSNREKGYLQELVYKLSKVGQAIDNNDLSTAGSVLGLDANADWVQNVDTAFNKLSSSPEEKTEVDAFKSYLSSLFSSVAKQDIESSKVAFVSSATALEKWMDLTGLVGQLKGCLKNM